CPLPPDADLDEDEVRAVERTVELTGDDERPAVALAIEHSLRHSANHVSPLLVDVVQHELAHVEACEAGDELGRVRRAATDDGDLHAVSLNASSGSARWHATSRDGPSGRRSGVSARQTSSAYGHRPAKRQPGAGSTTRGGSPVSSPTSSSGARGSGTAESSSCVYGCLGRCNTSSVGPCSTRCPPYMTRTRSAT